MLDLFFVSSPFQLICALEAREYYGSRNNVLIIREQINELAEQHIRDINDDKWTHTLFLREKPKKLALPRMVSLLRELKKLQKSLEFNAVFFAEYSSWRMRVIIGNISAHKQIMFDDGTMTLTEFTENISTGKRFSVKRASKERTLRMFGFRGAGDVYCDSSFQLFTYFRIVSNKIKVVRNEFSRLNALLSISGMYSDNGCVVLIGDGLIKEIGAQGYKSLVQEIAEANENRNIYYFKHRNEPREIRTQLESINGLVYVDSKRPIEFQLAELDCSVGLIIGFCSSALISLKRIYGDIPTYYRILDENYISDEALLSRIANMGQHFDQEGLINWG